MQIHPQEGLLQQARKLQQSPAFAEMRRRRRQVVQHRIARLAQLGIRRGEACRANQDVISGVECRLGAYAYAPTRRIVQFSLLGLRFSDALVYAAELHRYQLRKGGQIPMRRTC